MCQNVRNDKLEIMFTKQVFNSGKYTMPDISLNLPQSFQTISSTETSACENEVYQNCHNPFPHMTNLKHVVID